MKIISWNVNGIRAIAKKSFFTHIETLDADILCFQETKAQEDQVIETLSSLHGYHIYSHSAERKGYSGTAVISRIRPVNIQYGIGIDQHDSEGRVITLEYADFYLVNVYVPNSGSELLRLDYRQEWDKAFFDFLKELEQKKPVIVGGDMNVAHKPEDIARPKANYNKTAGYMQQEIDGMDRYLTGGFVDSFRYMHPDLKDAYSWWSYRGGARAKNIGWRIDYFLVSQSLTAKLKNATIYPELEGSDHCPIEIVLEIE